MTTKERMIKIRSYFTDERSLRIFEKRSEIGSKKNLIFPAMFDLAGCSSVNTSTLWNTLNSYIPELQDPARNVFIYGAGAGCRSVIYRAGQALGVQGIVGIIDNNVRERERYGLPILSFAEFLERHRDALVLNSIGLPAGKDVHQQCLEAGVDVVSLFECDLSLEQYFDLPAELGLVHDGEVFVQAGCYNGDTQKSFVNWFGQNYSRMITFEPDAVQYQICKKNLENLKDIEVVQAGLSDLSGTMRFAQNLPGMSAISETGGDEIETVTLDEYMQGEKVTFIALDVEGEEYKALLGAEQTIRAWKPKLAISIYHKPEDLYELPELVKSFRPDYQLYLRHYHLLDMAETVMYAF